MSYREAGTDFVLWIASLLERALPYGTLHFEITGSGFALLKRRSFFSVIP
jgi:hypothetical protein